jgi:hypothetical protein
MASGYQDALRRAAELDEQANHHGLPGRNPTTGVYQLTETIRCDGRLNSVVHQRKWGPGATVGNKPDVEHPSQEQAAETRAPCDEPCPGHGAASSRAAVWLAREP